MAGVAADWLGLPLAETCLITLHLGSGASITAIANGASVDTSMGFTPLEGLPMGARCGDLDPGIAGFVARELNLSSDAIEHALWHDSGLRALAGTQDMRELLQRADAGDSDAALAIDIYCHRVRKYIGAYMAVLERVDAIVFTGGIGENAAPVRERIVRGLKGLGLVVDVGANQSVSGSCSVITTATSRVPALVIPTNEELQMACEVAPLLSPAGR